MQRGITLYIINSEWSSYQNYTSFKTLNSGYIKLIIQVGFLILSLPVHNMIFNLFSIVSKAISLREYIGSAYACKDGYYRAYSWLVKIWYNIHWIWRPESIHHAPAIKATLRSCAINLTIFYKPLNQASSYMLGLIRNDAKIWRNNKRI